MRLQRIYVFWLLAIAGPGAPLSSEAAGLRARGGADSVSPADAEDQEDLIDADQSPAPQFPDQGVVEQGSNGLAAVMQQVPAAVPRRAAVSVPQRVAPVPAKLPVARPEALFQFTPPHQSPALPTAAMAAVVEGSRGVAKVHSNVSSQEAAPAGWPPSHRKYTTCDPPCIQGRGICNDNVCFCRSPFAGSTCQHKQAGLYRAPEVMVVGFAAVCFILGIVLSKLVFSFSEQAIETRLQRFGKGKQKYELWTPPGQDNKSKGKAGGK